MQISRCQVQNTNTSKIKIYIIKLLNRDQYVYRQHAKNYLKNKFGNQDKHSNNGDPNILLNKLKMRTTTRKGQHQCESLILKENKKISLL